MGCIWQLFKGEGMRKPLDALKKRLRLPSPSMVVALVALFVALSGGAYAITQFKTPS
jgi:hypothetical protein